VQAEPVHVTQFAEQAVHTPAFSKYPSLHVWQVVADVHALHPTEHAVQNEKCEFVELKYPKLQLVHKVLSLHVLQLT
jgi:hypothetical protein